MALSEHGEGIADCDSQGNQLLRCNFPRCLRDWNHARGVDHRYSDALGEKGLLRRDRRDETRHLPTKKGKKITYPACKPRKRERLFFGPPLKRRVPLSERALRGRTTLPPFVRPEDGPCCYSAALRSRLRLPSQSRQCATVARRERWRTGRALARPCHGA